ncbi:MAG: FAD-dependent oxidoreductase [Rhodobacteraceae bacterium]|nr:FAD-dependent oxidoreductase [Paracoccaceae bacterium]
MGRRLVFAGEATHPDHPATVHGAFLSGQNAARTVMEHAG